jgi:hypothetical protein
MPGLELHLHINYVTRGDAYLVAVGSHPLLGGGDVSRALRLHPIGEGNWHASVCFDRDRDLVLEDASTPVSIDYKYVVVSGSGAADSQRMEATQAIRSVLVDETLFQQAGTGVVHLYCYDSWRVAQSSVFATSAFVDVIFRKLNVPKTTSWLQLDTAAAARMRWSHQEPTSTQAVIRVRFVSYVPRLEAGHQVFVTGSPEALGAWNPMKQIPMFPIGSCLYASMVSIPVAAIPFEYRYVIAKDQEQPNLICAEQGSNRTLRIPQRCPETRFIHVDDVFRYATVWKGAGVAIPLISLRSRHSAGAGDFGDLKLFITAALSGNALHSCR